MEGTFGREGSGPGGPLGLISTAEGADRGPAGEIACGRVSIKVQPGQRALRTGQTLSSREMLGSTLRSARTLVCALPAVATLLAVYGCAEGARGEAGEEGAFTVAAASSLAGVAQELVARWEVAGEPAPRLTLGSSATLARQLEEGAPFDVFLSADERWVEHLTDGGQLEAASQVELGRGRLVVAVRSGVMADGRLRSAGRGPADGELPAGRWACGDPAYVPLGEYAREALVAREEWSARGPEMLPAGSARAALRLVEMGEVDWGILYRSDAVGAADVRVLFELGESLHRPIRYRAAMAPDAGASARRFMESLEGPAAAASLSSHGFEPAVAEGGQ